MKNTKSWAHTQEEEDIGMTLRYMKQCSIVLAIMKCLWELWQYQAWLECLATGVGCKITSLRMQRRTEGYNQEWTNDPEIPSLSIFSREMKLYVHTNMAMCSMTDFYIIVQISKHIMNRWQMVQPYNVMAHSKGQERAWDLWEAPWKHHAEW